MAEMEKGVATGAPGDKIMAPRDEEEPDTLGTIPASVRGRYSCQYAGCR